jgi:hypothetical protein
VDSSQNVLSGNKHQDIHALGQYIEGHIAGTWDTLLEQNRDKLLDAFDRGGDMAYGTYLNLLLRPVHKQLKLAGLRPKPKLPGEFDTSREWGNADESDQQRWMWSTIHAADGEPLGTIVMIVFHDHTQFRIPRQPQVIALPETSKDAVVEALSRRSADFAQALEFTIWYEEYQRSQQG